MYAEGRGAVFPRNAGHTLIEVVGIRWVELVVSRLVVEPISFKQIPTLKKKNVI